MKTCTFKQSSMHLCSWPSRELWKSPTQLPKMLTHLAIVFTALSWLRAQESHYQLTDPLHPDWLLQGLIPNRLTLFILLFQSHRFSWAQLFVWSSCQSRQSVFWTLWGCFKDARDKVPVLGHQSTHTHTHTHTRPHTHIHIYTHTLECSLLCHISTAKS